MAFKNKKSGMTYLNDSIVIDVVNHENHEKFQFIFMTSIIPR